MMQFIRVLIIALVVFVAGCASMGITEQWPWYYKDSPYHRQTGTIER